MFPSSSSSSQELLWSLYNRRLLMHNEAPSQPNATESSTTPSNGFDANLVMVFSVLLCALVCSLGLHSIVKCTLRCSSFISRNSNQYENENDNNNYQVRAAGLANTGIKKAALKTFPTVSYSADLQIPGLDSECVICLSEFAPGERVRLLPKCNHGFHVRCIDKWLNSHSSCPTCRHCLIETCQKIVSCNQASTSQETVINMAPLAREEDMIHIWIT